MPKKLAKRVPRPKKSAHLIIVGYVGALYTARVLGNHPIPVKLQRIFFESVCEGVTKRKILVLPFRNRRSVNASRVCLPCINHVRSTWAGFFLLKPAFKKASPTMIAFSFKKKQDVRITSWFRGKVIQWLRCQLLSIASTWSLIILHNGDAAIVLRSFLFVWVSLSRTTAKLNFSQNPWEELPWHSFAPVNPKQPGAALLWARICLKIVPNSRQAHFP